MARLSRSGGSKRALIPSSEDVLLPHSQPDHTAACPIPTRDLSIPCSLMCRKFIPSKAVFRLSVALWHCFRVYFSSLCCTCTLCGCVPHICLCGVCVGIGAMHIFVCAISPGYHEQSDPSGYGV